MLPSLFIRSLIVLGVALGGFCWLLALPILAPIDGSTGISLFDARGGWIAAVGVLLLCGIPAIGLALMAGTAGSPLAGPFVAAFALLIVAAKGGSSRGYLWRADLPTDYAQLILETLIWSAGLLALMLAVGVCRRVARQRYPNLGSRNGAEPPPGGWRRIGAADALAGAAAAVLGAALSGLLIQSTATGQVLGSLVLAFALSALLAQLVVPHDNPLPILLAPSAAAIGGYVWVLLSPELVGHRSVLEAWYTGRLTGLAMTLPIQYLSAGVVGVTLGMGLGQALNSASESERQRVGVAVKD